MLASLVALTLATYATPKQPPATPASLLRTYSDPIELMLNAQRGCKDEPTLLACFSYLRRVYALANPQQRQALGQILSPQASFLGRYRDARRYDPFNHLQRPTIQDVDPPPSSDTAVDAVDAVARWARRRRIVMVNEFHTDPSTRALTIALLPRLYAEGFRYLAVEAVTEDGSALVKRGYAVHGTGYYTRDPVFATLLSRAIKLGYTVVSYDVHTSSQQQREDGQARDIYRKIFKHDPAARVLVHAGIAHIGEKPGGFGPGVQPMAMRLRALTGIDPLTVDQTTLRARKGTPLRRQLVGRYHPEHPAVIEDGRGRPWSAIPGRYDVTVVAPALSSTQARPDWLALDGTRTPVAIDPRWCKDVLPCSIEARPSARAEDAIASDRYAFLHHPARVRLYLSPGRYRIEAYSAGGKLLSSHTLNVKREDSP